MTLNLLQNMSEIPSSNDSNTNLGRKLVLWVSYFCLILGVILVIIPTVVLIYQILFLGLSIPSNSILNFFASTNFMVFVGVLFLFGFL